MVSCNCLQHGQINTYLKNPSDLKLFLVVLVSPVPKIFCWLHRYQKLQGLDKGPFQIS